MGGNNADLLHTRNVILNIDDEKRLRVIDDETLLLTTYAYPDGVFWDEMKIEPRVCVRYRVLGKWQ